MLDKALFDHGNEIFGVSAVWASGRYKALIRIFTPAGETTAVVDADEAGELIEVLKAIVAKDAEERLKAKEASPAPIGGVFPGFGTNGSGGSNA